MITICYLNYFQTYSYDTKTKNLMQNIEIFIPLLLLTSEAVKFMAVTTSLAISLTSTYLQKVRK